MSDMQINQVLAQMRVMSAQAKGPSAVEESAAAAVNKTSFSDLLENSLQKVNETQMEASSLKTAFEKGDPDVNLVDVMVAMQKSSVSFQAVTQVRNKVLAAYQEIMSMPL